MLWGFIEPGVNPLSLVRVKGISCRQTEPWIVIGKEIPSLIAALSTEPYHTMVAMALGEVERFQPLLDSKRSAPRR